MAANSTQWERINNVFHAALKRSPPERDAFLAAECGADSQLRVEVQSLIAAHTSNPSSLVTPGTRLGDYEVTAFLAAGGMGQVYRARDTKLGRDVALKILPPAFVTDSDRRARFEREARLLASLNHPHIATIYGFVESDGISALALELVDGETLAERIARGRMPVNEALRIAKQIAEALEAAHEQGIIHRDLKPANIKLTRDGAVKVLDFGLAKLTQSAATAELGVGSAITHAGGMTGAQVLLGTPAYMSPEQVGGEVVDKRADIWAFGCVLFEMLTGKPAFDGHSVTEVLAQVLERNVDLTSLPADASPALRYLLRRTLEKNPKQRLRDIGEARVQLERDKGAFVGEGNVPADSRSTRRFTLMATITVVLLATAGFVWVAATRPLPSSGFRPARFEITPSPESRISLVARRPVAIAPDGAYIVYVGGDASELWVRRVDQLDAVRLPGTSGAVQPFVSSDSQWIGFIAANELRKVRVDGGPVVTVYRHGSPIYGATWGESDTIYLGTTEGLSAVPASGGKPRLISAADKGKGEYGDQDLTLIRGRNAILSKHYSRPNLIEAVDLRSGVRKPLLRGATYPQFVDTGHLLYIDATGNVMASRFDVSDLELRGDSVPVLQLSELSAGHRDLADFAVSPSGALVYVPEAATAGQRTLAWFDGDGHQEDTGAPPRNYQVVRLSPDGTRAVVSIFDVQRDIWTWDLARRTLARLTFDGASFNPVWTSDGHRIIFESERTGHRELFSMPADGSGVPTRIGPPLDALPKTTTPDGLNLLVVVGRFLTLVSLTDPSRAEPLTRTSLDANDPDISADGRWIAYQARDSGRDEIYVRSFPNVETGRWQVSFDGGLQPAWSSDGRVLYFREASGRVMRVNVETKATFAASMPALVVDGVPLTNSGAWSYDLSPDGRRFLIIREPSGTNDPSVASRSIVVVQNWLDELMRLVPAK